MDRIPVFIVDDSSFYVKILSAKLRKIEALEVHEFHTGEEVLAKSGVEPKILVADYYLNSKEADAINGVKLIYELRKKYSDLAAIVLSGRADLTSSSKSDELMKVLYDKPNSLKKRFQEGDFFYLVKDNEAPAEVFRIIKNMVKEELL